METERNGKADNKGIRRMETNRNRSFIVVCLVISHLALFGNMADATEPPPAQCNPACSGCDKCVNGSCQPPDTSCEDCQVYDWEDCACKDVGCLDNCQTGCCPGAGEPVYIKTGEFRESFTDLSIKGRAMTVEITRTYGSQREYQSVFGYGWDINYDLRLYRQGAGSPPEEIVYADGQACKHVYTQDTVNHDIYRRQADLGKYFLYDDANDTFTLIIINGEDYAFDANDQLGSITDVEGNQIAFGYDPNGLLTTITDDLGREIILEYNEDDLLEKVTDFASRVWSYQYDGSGNLWKVTGPNTPEYENGLTETYAYDSYHNLTTITDPNNQVRVQNYYSNDKVYKQDYGAGYYQFSYDEQNKKATVTDREGNGTEMYYGDDGELVKEVVSTASGSLTTEYSYNADIQKTLTKLPKGNCIAYVYDDGDLVGEYRKTGIDDPNIASNENVAATTYTYDPNWAGKYATVTDALGNVTSYEYYAGTGLLKKVTYPEVDSNTPTVEYTYDNENRLETVTDEAGMVTKYEYYGDSDANGWGRLKKVIVDANETEGLKLTTEYKYDVFGDIVEVKDPNGNVTKSWYNNLRQLTQTQTPLEYITRYHYDKDGNVNKIERQSVGSALYIVTPRRASRRGGYAAGRSWPEP